MLAWNAEHDASRQGRILQCLGNTHASASEALDAFIRSLGMPRTLSEVGVGEDRFHPDQLLARPAVAKEVQAARVGRDRAAHGRRVADYLANIGSCSRPPEIR